MAKEFNYLSKKDVSGTEKFARFMHTTQVIANKINYIIKETSEGSVIKLKTRGKYRNYSEECLKPVPGIKDIKAVIFRLNILKKKFLALRKGSETIDKDDEVELYTLRDYLVPDLDNKGSEIIKSEKLWLKRHNELEKDFEYIFEEIKHLRK